MVIASCSSEQVQEPKPEVKGTAIAFSGNLTEEEVTRAESPLAEKRTVFTVWAYKSMSVNAGSYGDNQTVMDGFHVQWTANSAATTTTNSHDWDYIISAYPDQTIKYWDFDAKAYRFFAVTNGVVGTEKTVEDHKVYELTFPADATEVSTTPYYSKLWFSNDINVFGKPVTLEFKQPLSKVRFMFTVGTPAPTLIGPDFRPADGTKRIGTKGTVTLTYPLTGSSTEGSWAIDASSITKSISSFTHPWSTSDQYWYTVLPIIGQGAYELTVTVNGEDKSCAVPAQFMDWQPGFCYTYVFKVNAEGEVELGTFYIGVQNWNDGDDAEYIVFNW